MSTEENIKKTGGGKISSILLEIANGFISGLTSILEQNLDNVVKKQEKKIFRSFSVAGLFFAGVSFALIGIAIYMNEFFNVGNWPGYLLVGLVLIVIGFILQKSSK
jgi:drug/metabolite transporter (DMT)-like permease